MKQFSYQNGELYAENIAISSLIAHYGSPCYLYSRDFLEQQWHAFDAAFGTHPHLICYAVKANSNLAILNVLARLGSGFDIVSVGELERVLAAGGQANKIVFSGVGKREDEILAALRANIRCFNIEVSDELDRINALAGQLGVRAPVSFRVNPNVDAKTHPYIATGLKENKFGIDITQAFEQYRRAALMPHIEVIGIDCHIGSQLTEQQPFLDALDKVLELVTALAKEGIRLHHLDIGGGLGICYKNEQPPEPADYIHALLARLNDHTIELLIEPGRAIVGNAGILVTQVEYLKPTDHKNFAIVDAAMNDLLRPSLYSAWQDIIPIQQHSNAATLRWDVVGPVCETGDFLGKDRDLALSPGDLLAVCSSGAYGFSMSSNYNSRPRAVEVMVSADQHYLIRARETLPSLWTGEQVLPEQLFLN
ncbi:MAG: diaminopimelate decarboxylase [Methylococcaceae bacterium]|nr:MAG: diaminopimelate decarboxylase [Methylococcaceae bacterium]